jgi:hypothetical protein
MLELIGSKAPKRLAGRRKSRINKDAINHFGV